MYIKYISETYLNVSTSAVDFLLMLNCELNDEGLVLVGEALVAGGESVELGVLGGLETLDLVPFAGGELELAIIVLVARLDPSGLPAV